MITEIREVPADAIVDHLRPGARLIVPILLGEPPAIIEALERNYERLDNVEVHHMFAQFPREYHTGKFAPNLKHVDFFLGASSRAAQREGGNEYYPCNFSDIPRIVRERVKPDMIICQVSEPDEHGFMSMGLNADYVSPFIGQVPAFVEINPTMPRTLGANQIHVSQVVGACRNETPVTEMPSAPATDDISITIARLVADEIEDKSSIQIGFGKLPDAILAQLHDRKDLGIHTETMADGVMNLYEAGAVTGRYKKLHPGFMTASFLIGTRKMYDWVDNNPAVYMESVNITNDPRIISQDPRIVSVNATTEVDLYGQAASETMAGRFHSGSGGQSDFVVGTHMSDGGKGFIVTPARTSRGDARIKLQLTPGSVVTAHKNYIDNVVTEYGIARLRNATYSERAKRLIEIAHPDDRETLWRQAREAALVSRYVD